jgi:adenylate cyclase
MNLILPSVMGKFKRANRHKEFYDTFTTLELEETKSEFQRSYLLIFLFSIIFVVSVSNFLLLDNNVASFYGGHSAFYAIVVGILVFLFYQSVVIQVLKQKIRTSDQIPTQFKIIHTLIEISFPSAMTFYMMSQYQIVSFIESPVMMIYFLLIILSILHLDFRVSLFTGALAAVQYALLVYYGSHYIDTPEKYMMSVPANSHYIRSIILVLCGGAAAFVSFDLKRRIKFAYDSLQEKNKLELLFGQHVSKEVSKALIEEKGATKRLEGTVMFLDIRNFTNFADLHSADDVVDFQNKFFGPVIDIINQHQGVVLQLLGDGLMACFGTPVENTLHADMAFQASLKVLNHVKAASLSGGIPPTTIGIGLHSGMMIAGNIGNEQRKQFSISGTPVIIASRIEQLNKKHQTEFLISGEVHQRITPGKIKLNFIGEEPLKGLEKPVHVYSVLAEY